MYLSTNSLSIAQKAQVPHAYLCMHAHMFPHATLDDDDVPQNSMCVCAQVSVHSLNQGFNDHLQLFSLDAYHEMMRVRVRVRVHGRVRS